jgi:tetratricopeptide (TPR) repeat protein
MDRVRWKTVNEIFHAALELPAGERDAFLSAAADGDVELIAEVEDLLKADEDAGSYFESPLIARESLLAPPPSVNPGDVLCGRFKIVRAVAEGGMGHVFEAFDSELTVPVALKVIRPEIASNPEALRRFRQEVRLARRITHPNICRTFDFERDVRVVDPESGTEQEIVFLTMEFLEGETLAAHIQQNGAIPMDLGLHIARQIADALVAARSLGVVHRDVKPANVMLVANANSDRQTFRVVITDFGLARIDPPGSTRHRSSLSHTARPLGTLAYMAPEQLEGKPVSAATDIYAFGLVLFEMATGQRAFPSDNFLNGITQRLRGSAPNPETLVPDLPETWRHAIDGCLRTRPEERFKSAADVVSVLEGGKVKPPATWKKDRRPTQRRILYAVITAAACGAMIFFWTRARVYQTPDPRAFDWYEEGTAALREGEFVQAAHELQQAVNLDKNFAVAHARLAEAWAELDFSGPAQSEMILASGPEQQSGLPDLDRKYIDAVRAMLLSDYAGAVRDQQDILNVLPDDQKGFGYVDLGRAQEKAGDIQGALKSYQTAVKLTPDNPAPFVHLGILLGRQRDDAEAKQAFQRAEDLYRTKGNIEGIGEVAYQRGHYENELGQSALAEPDLKKCLEIGQEIQSVQLEVRALTQLSNAEYFTGQIDLAIENANLAYKQASENGLEYWATDALMRKGTAYFLEGDYTTAGALLLDALQRAEQNQHPRLKANTELTLASLRDQQGNRDDQKRYAQDALHYYNQYGFLGLARSATTLLTRAQEAKDEYEAAFQSATDLLELAQKSNTGSSLEVAHEALGDVLSDLERFPDALMHYESALSAAQSMNADLSLQALHCSEMLWRLGRYDEADASLRLIKAQAAAQTNVASGIELTRAGMRLSQERFAEVIDIANSELKKPDQLTPIRAVEFKRLETVAEVRSGQTGAAMKDARQLLEMARRVGDGDYIAKAELVQAEVLIRTHEPDNARNLADAAYRQFALNNEAESEWVSLLCVAQAAAEQGDFRSAAEGAKHGADVLKQIEKDWGTPTFTSYSERQDIHALKGQLEKLANQ